LEGTRCKIEKKIKRCSCYNHNRKTQETN